MFINPINSIIIQYDERFTINLLLLSWNDMWTTIFADVHPPLYYLILKGISSIFINSGVDTVFVYKVVSIIPYILLLVVSVTKIRNDYGWFTSGLFMFTIATMSEFFIKFLTIRMYSWGLLFLVLAFIYLKDVMDKSDTKSWALFTLFVVLAMYIHNIILIPLGLIYVLLLVYIYVFKDNFKEELKKMVNISNYHCSLLFALVICIDKSNQYTTW